ncbi:hypothetical protein BJ170DRAFT_592441 [Xylariales sp. AK1849]|nr:hypothetical protein BJ170DRAFT_592441 [Xylariales sp. AK1849]
MDVVMVWCGNQGGEYLGSEWAACQGQPQSLNGGTVSREQGAGKQGAKGAGSLSQLLCIPALHYCASYPSSALSGLVQGKGATSSNASEPIAIPEYNTWRVSPTSRRRDVSSNSKQAMKKLRMKIPYTLCLIRLAIPRLHDGARLSRASVYIVRSVTRLGLRRMLRGLYIVQTERHEYLLSPLSDSVIQSKLSQRTGGLDECQILSVLSQISGIRGGILAKPLPYSLRNLAWRYAVTLRQSSSIQFNVLSSHDRNYTEAEVTWQVHSRAVAERENRHGQSAPSPASTTCVIITCITFLGKVEETTSVQPAYMGLPTASS